jgi:hypothetical protein
MPIFAKKFSLFLRSDRKTVDPVNPAQTRAEASRFDPGLALGRRAKASIRTKAGGIFHFAFAGMAPFPLALAVAELLSCSLVAVAGKATQKRQRTASSS